jgi:DNA-directed RNA polymerase subunit K/omega
MDDYEEDDDFEPEANVPVEEDRDLNVFMEEADQQPEGVVAPEDDTLEDSEDEDANVPEVEVVKIADDIPTTYIVGDARILNPRMTKYERARICSMRATQIERGDQVFVACDSSDPGEITLAEIAAGRCPLAVKRVIKPPTATTGGEYEYWPVRDLIWGSD